MDTSYRIDSANVTPLWRHGENDQAVSAGPFSAAMQETLDSMPAILDSAHAPQPTAEQLAASQPYLEVWQNGKKVADVSQGAFLTTGNSVNVDQIVAKDGTLTGKDLADQRARLVKDMLGAGAEIRCAGAASTTTVSPSAATSTIGSYLRWLNQNS